MMQTARRSSGNSSGGGRGSQQGLTATLPGCTYTVHSFAQSASCSIAKDQLCMATVVMPKQLVWLLSRGLQKVEG